MPRPNQGDLVLFSNDIHNFTSPSIGWVMKEPGHSTLQILVFTEQNGWLVKPSVHHKDDPAMKGEHNWEGLGVWDFPLSAKQPTADKPEKNTKQEGKFFGR
jgi:hypothetical protein